MRIKAKVKNGITTVKAMAKHPMLSYLEAETASKKKGEKVDGNFITNIIGKYNNEIVYQASTSQFLSKNPYFKFSFRGGNKGEEIEINWADLKGNKKNTKSKIK